MVARDLEVVAVLDAVVGLCFSVGNCLGVVVVAVVAGNVEVVSSAAVLE